MGAGVPFPSWRESGIFAVLCAAKDGSSATIYGLHSYRHLLILDFETGFFDAYWLQSVGLRLDALSAEIPVSLTAQTYAKHYGTHITSAIFCQPLLAAQAHSLETATGTCTIEHLPDIDVNNLVPIAVKHIGAGSVQLSTLAVQKGRSSPIGGCLDYRPGCSLEDDALRTAVTWCIVAAFENAFNVRKGFKWLTMFMVYPCLRTHVK